MSENPQFYTSHSGSGLASLQKSVSFDKFTMNSSNGGRRSFVRDLRMKVVDNNIRGKTVDKITLEQAKPCVGQIVSTYGIDYCTTSKRPSTSGIDQKYNTSGTSMSRGTRTFTRTNDKKNHFVTQSQPNLVLNSELNENQAAITQGIRTEDSTNQNACTFDASHPMSNELNAIIDENAEYFNHVLGRCACGKCICGKHKCKHSHLKIKKKAPSSTIYQQDFIKVPIGEPIVPLKNDFFTTFYNNQSMGLATTMRSDFKSWNVGAPPRAKDTTSFHSVPFAGKTSYKAEYINWRSGPVNIEKASQPLTILSELPFISETTYSKTHGAWAPSLTESQKKKYEKSPIASGIPFLGETTTMKTYKPYKIGPNRDYKKPGEKWESINSYPDQFRSTFAKDFSSPDKGPCPSIEFIKTQTGFGSFKQQREQKREHEDKRY